MPALPHVTMGWPSVDGGGACAHSTGELGGVVDVASSMGTQTGVVAAGGGMLDEASRGVAVGGKAVSAGGGGLDEVGRGVAAGGTVPVGVADDEGDEPVAAGGIAPVRRRGTAATGTCSTRTGAVGGVGGGEGTWRKGKTSSSNTTCLVVSTRHVDGL